MRGEGGATRNPGEHLVPGRTDKPSQVISRSAPLGPQDIRYAPVNKKG